MNQELAEHQWEGVWKRTTLLTHLINNGREIYNFFFRRQLRKYLNAQSAMLELGCGTSTLTLSLAPHIARLVGLDISDTALELSKKYAKNNGISNATFIKGDCFAVPFENEFDFVWSQGLIEHFDNSAAIVGEHYKALKSGGTALISVPYRYSYHYLWYVITRPKILRQFWPWTEQKFFTRNELLDLGRHISNSSKIIFLKPFFLGIMMLEIRKS